MNINSEDLAYWFLRLNGFLTIQNFVVHPDEGANQRTDVDLVAVRFPFRNELLKEPMEDFELFRNMKKIFVVFTEVKRGRCEINGPWTNQEKGNMQRVLCAIGTHESTAVEEIAKNIYQNGIYVDNNYCISLLSIGRDKNEDLKKKYPAVQQIAYSEIIEFVYERFSKYPDIKADHTQWDTNGKNLWQAFQDSGSFQTFAGSIQIQ